MSTLKKQLKNSFVILLATMVLAAYCPLDGFAESEVVSYIDAKGNQLQCTDK